MTQVVCPIGMVMEYLIFVQMIATQGDTDGDGWGDECDSCPEIYLPFQQASKCLSKGTIQVCLSMEEMSLERKQDFLAKIMEKLLDMYYNN